MTQLDRWETELNEATVFSFLFAIFLATQAQAAGATESPKI
nr:hypothetical protein [uncultured bacterium]